ncbi:MAG: ATP-binding cassette domain-containing protein, partial [Pseudomonadales bacterium]
MLQFIDVHLKRGDNEIFEKLNLTVHAGHRVGVVGRNGVGKTTLFLLARHLLLPEEGDVIVPNSWRIAHMEQEPGASDLPALEFVLDGHEELRRVQRKIRKAEERNDDHALGELYAKLEAIDGYTAEARAGEIMHGLGFTGEELMNRVSEFSGGWRIRLNLAQTLMCPSDLLLLDEPTNHLDIPSREILTDALGDYRGTICFITHDRTLIGEIANKIIEVRDGQIKVFPGNYDDYLRQSEAAATETSVTQTLRDLQQPDRPLSAVKKRQRKASEGRLRNEHYRSISPVNQRIGEIEQEIASAAERIKEIEAMIADPA